MQAILTKYHGPTNVKGSRISATCDAGRIVVSYDHALNGDGNHAAAAKALAIKLGWNGDYIGGTLPNGDHAWIATESGAWPGCVFSVTSATKAA